MSSIRFFITLSFIFILTACDDVETPPKPAPAVEVVEVVIPKEEVKERKAELVLAQKTFADLPGWGADHMDGFPTAFRKSCARISKRSENSIFGVLKQAGTYGQWQKICAKFTTDDVYTPKGLRAFFETHFTPHQVAADDELTGLFTGYYEASLKGSRVKTDRYNIPLHKRPDDLVMVQLGDFRKDLKGVRIAGRIKNGRLKPYESRAEIISGDWPHDDEVLLWVDSAVDAFFVQIQGSGLVTMKDGSLMRIGYAGQNGHPYYAIGRELIKIGALTKKNVSMQSIRAWLEENPARADEIMNTNRSYVFFREIKGDGPIGAEGVSLTAGRSLAVDRTLVSYGLPLWVDIESPTDGHARIRRMMVAQDTGGAIRGPVRGDFFWGHGQDAEDLAGIMKSKGRYWVMLPKVE